MRARWQKPAVVAGARPASYHATHHHLRQDPRASRTTAARPAPARRRAASPHAGVAGDLPARMGGRRSILRHRSLTTLAVSDGTGGCLSSRPIRRPGRSGSRGPGRSQRPDQQPQRRPRPPRRAGRSRVRRKRLGVERDRVRPSAQDYSEREDWLPQQCTDRVLPGGGEHLVQSPSRDPRLRRAHPGQPARRWARAVQDGRQGLGSSNWTMRVAVGTRLATSATCAATPSASEEARSATRPGPRAPGSATPLLNRRGRASTDRRPATLSGPSYPSSISSIASRSEDSSDRARRTSRPGRSAIRLRADRFPDGDPQQQRSSTPVRSALAQRTQELGECGGQGFRRDRSVLLRKRSPRASTRSRSRCPSCHGNTSCCTTTSSSPRPDPQVAEALHGAPAVPGLLDLDPDPALALGRRPPAVAEALLPPQCAPAAQSRRPPRPRSQQFTIWCRASLPFPARPVFQVGTAGHIHPPRWRVSAGDEASQRRAPRPRVVAHRGRCRRAGCAMRSRRRRTATTRATIQSRSPKLHSR